MTSLPDWLVERAALDEVPAASRARLDHADPRELDDRIAALRADNERELTAYPAGPAVAQIQTQLAAATRRRASRARTVRRSALAIASGAAALVIAVVVIRLVGGHTAIEQARPGSAAVQDDIRVKGKARLIAFRQVGDQAEQLAQDAFVRAGDVIQLRYNAGGKHYGVIASIDGAGVVTLHFPASEDAPPEATAVSTQTTALPHAYALDDAPRFERFFIITANEPIDVQQSLDALRTLAHQDDSADAPLELPDGVRQWSLRLRKPDASSPNHESP